ncbi:TIGR03862 family flavoprotein [Sneathiella chinensis]|uniref:NAD(FAD)-utilizing dehydrogenase n=1 Tax=Sneathiella chinensis TaxID=349750 RepID=A0ABQ5U8E2_9PROT|nr:TIGR03862 family flavoprotein [Sneathiella chinensis]GLQ07539.1 NAD(FAD)-utilizing dehydrogenase [Sneathiella chinensis]
MTPKSSKIVIIGGGPVGLMAAQILSETPAFDVHLYEQKPSVGRKFLLAGRGGLNLTHSEDSTRFAARFGKDEALFKTLMERFSPADLRDWAQQLGVDTFVGSSGRIFPTEMKATGLVRAWTKKLTEQGVTFHLQHRFLSFSEDRTVTFEGPDGHPVEVQADALLFGLGGASYPHLGSRGDWTDEFERHGLEMAPFRPTNCGFHVLWSRFILDRFEGMPLKNIRLEHEGNTSRGDMVVARYGLEGGALYALARPLAETLDREGQATLNIDLRPDMDLPEVEQRLSQPRGKASLSSFLKKTLKLTPLEIALLQEFSGPPQSGAAALAERIKKIPAEISGIRPIERAISSAGGIAMNEVDSGMMLKSRPGIFIGGEMMDWEAPTGGYLLQGCFSMAVAAADGIRHWLDQTPATNG